jgi:uncharacterized Zn-binding protein involved in type VI secretion
MPAATRIGDPDNAHCSGMVRAAGSGNVFANGIGISRQGDNNTVHVIARFSLSSSCSAYFYRFSSKYL